MILYFVSAGDSVALERSPSFYQLSNQL